MTATYKSENILSFDSCQAPAQYSNIGPLTVSGPGDRMAATYKSGNILSFPSCQAPVQYSNSGPQFQDQGIEWPPHTRVRIFFPFLLVRPPSSILIVVPLQFQDRGIEWPPDTRVRIFFPSLPVRPPSIILIVPPCSFRTTG